MKKINLNKLMSDNGISIDRMEMLGMEFIKLKDGNYMIHNSNGKIVSEKEKLQMEKEGLIVEDFKSNKCQKEAKKKIEEIDESIKETNKTISRHNKSK